ncbi:CGNR zinc finger domain-containing protein [Nocardiopsis metallicus]|uniref:Putative RNA-binding Zn ribbon-like protein n=1 Tax=Nocardiopsis metallicus TaxID=179819 RepID=A0A840VZX2_9ACTN|nr:CGNR zinc finger domain-containing protein [Nocardiopsis metallicus]MBB5490070.1 putative RNA-binding Zn ribbon-like protein [Nocardiopsis metallicus]
MHLNPYGQDPLALAVDLVNRPCADTADLEQRCAGAGFLLERAVGEADLAAVRDFLIGWAEVIDSPDEPTRAARLNALLAEYSGPPRLTDHAGTGWHLHYRPDDLPAHRQIAALVAVGTALHLTGRGMSRLGRCAARDCTHVYADFSRNGRQRYCSSVCGNRDAVRRHRVRAARENGGRESGRALPGT